MGKSLVIVESPAKAKTINKYLGPDFIVKSSIGHIRDLPTSGSGASKADPKERAAQAARTRKMAPKQKAEYKKKNARKQLVRRMGIDPDSGWSANYQVLPGKEKVVNELTKLAAKSDAIYLATDLDREGEAIAWHLKEAIGGDPSRYQRVVFNEITKKAITEAFQEPSKLDMDRVNAQQARRFLDRVVGFMVSPLLWAKVARGLSAGRVQSVAVRLIVEREREVQTQKALEENAAAAKPKPDAVIQNNIIPGRMKKFLEEVTLLGQKFVINPDLTVEQAAKDAGVEITGFVRMAVGDGIEKKEEDFAAAGAKTLGN